MIVATIVIIAWTLCAMGVGHAATRRWGKGETGDWIACFFLWPLLFISLCTEDRS